MKANDDKKNLHVGQTGSKKDLNYDLTGADFDLFSSAIDENQNYAIKEDEGNDYYSIGGDDYYYLEVEEG